jgi:Sigma-70 region 2
MVSQETLLSYSGALVCSESVRVSRHDEGSVGPSELPPLTEEGTLIEGLRNGDEQAFETLVRKFGPRLLATARSYLRSEDDVCDLLQDAFLCALKSIGNFKGGRFAVVDLVTADRHKSSTAPRASGAQKFDRARADIVTVARKAASKKGKNYECYYLSRSHNGNDLQGSDGNGSENRLSRSRGYRKSQARAATRISRVVAPVPQSDPLTVGSVPRHRAGLPWVWR